MTTGIRNPEQAARMEAAMIPTDTALASVEQTWGVGRLPRLVSSATVLRWREGWTRYCAAITEGDVESVERIAPKICQALAAMEQEARAAGHAPLSPEVWEAPLADGTVLQVVRTLAEATAVLRRPDDRQRQVWTLAEIARVLPLHSVVADVKRAFPGATVEAMPRRSEGFARDWVERDPLLEHLHGVAAE